MAFMKTNRVRCSPPAITGVLVLLYLVYALVYPSRIKQRAVRVHNVDGLWSLSFSFTNAPATNANDPMR